MRKTEKLREIYIIRCSEYRTGCLGVHEAL